jgi:hypothetical protein
MPDGIFVEVKGIPELDALISQLAGPGADRAMVHGVAEGAKIFQEAITDAAPIRPELPSGTALPPGKLKSSIQIRLSKLRNGTFATFIEPSRDVRHVARWVEWGHRLVKGGRSQKSKRGGGYTGSGKEVGFVEPYHGTGFIRPAFETSEQTAIEVVKETILSDLVAEAENLGLR